MANQVYCPACGGPGKVERDWLGDEIHRCDAYARCAEEVQEYAQSLVERGLSEYWVQHWTETYLNEDRRRLRLVDPASTDPLHLEEEPPYV